MIRQNSGESKDSRLRIELVPGIIHKESVQLCHGKTTAPSCPGKYPCGDFQLSDACIRNEGIEFFSEIVYAEACYAHAEEEDCNPSSNIETRQANKLDMKKKSFDFSTIHSPDGPTHYQPSMP